MRHVVHSIRSALREERAATMPEYALMVALIAVVCIVAVGLVGTSANTIFGNIATALAAAGG
ncbi:MAG TPA: Flp family type IVb pilin [Gemmatimonadaceae bacterium]|nr:Flp family type IVb pilin [Gemmatimonadaceae bacterium]